jgi:hypothetical protein
MLPKVPAGRDIGDEIQKLKQEVTVVRGHIVQAELELHRLEKQLEPGLSGDGLIGSELEDFKKTEAVSKARKELISLEEIKAQKEVQIVGMMDELERTTAEDEALDGRLRGVLSNSNRQQYYSSMTQEPVTPMTATDSVVVKIDRTVPDSYEDVLYLPQQMPTSQRSKAARPLLSLYYEQSDEDLDVQQDKLGSGNQGWAYTTQRSHKPINKPSDQVERNNEDAGKLGDGVRPVGEPEEPEQDEEADRLLALWTTVRREDIKVGKALRKPTDSDEDEEVKYLKSFG